MNRSVDTPVADAWPGDDPLLQRLSAARPEPPARLLDPRSADARATLDRILGDPAAGRPGRRTQARPERARPPRRTARRLAPRVAAVVAAAAAVAALVVVAPIGSPAPRAEAIVRDAAAASGEALGTSRAVMTVEGGNYGDRYEYAFAGDDHSVVITATSPDGSPSVGERRVIGGETYFWWSPDGAPEQPDWLHDVTPGAVRQDTTEPDPRGLLATLAPTAGFELVGDDTVDGVAVTRLRATSPEAIDVHGLGIDEVLNGIGPVVEALDVWVDGDDVVRRIDVTIGYDEPMDGFVVLDEETPGGTGSPPVELPEGISFAETTVSVTFTDVGSPITIELPAGARDISMLDPIPPA
ncbi:MAG TPA: hypothetical protein VFI47_18190 [Acidimicrobiales bacterium]|nr:hypothetical protein [Acidimicrobiales bacterium]